MLGPRMGEGEADPGDFDILREAKSTLKTRSLFYGIQKIPPKFPTLGASSGVNIPISQKKNSSNFHLKRPGLIIRKQIPIKKRTSLQR